MAVIGYIRVSTTVQNTENQKLAILEYANTHKMGVDHWIEVTSSSRKSARIRKIDELRDRLEAEDVVIVAELSRLGRSVGQIIILMDELLNRGVRVICIKENMVMAGQRDIQTKVMITLFGLFAEIERDLISERTKEGLDRARKDGKLLGRPKGRLSESKLDGKEDEIREYMRKGVNKANIARIYEVSWPTIANFIKGRRLAEKVG